MSPRWIEIDDEVLAQIGARAEAFLDSPNDVLRRAFGLSAAERPSCAPLPAEGPAGEGPRAGGLARAKPGTLLALAEYELPILKALAEHGGSASRAQIVAAVAEKLRGRFTEVDRGRLQSGDVRWESRVGFARQQAIERGYLNAESPRGLWELTEAGKERLRELEAVSAEAGGSER